MLTRDVAETLQRGVILHHTQKVNSDGTPLRARVAGKCQTWKARPEEFSLPVKYGFRFSFRITHRDADRWELPSA